MSDLVLTFTVFHTLAFLGIFGFMVAGVVQAIQRKRNS
jgi:hypothetical protein